MGRSGPSGHRPVPPHRDGSFPTVITADHIKEDPVKNAKKALMMTAAVGGLAIAGAAAASADAGALGSASRSPGAVSGNTIQLPINVPINACGDTVDVHAHLNPAVMDTCVNGNGRYAPPMDGDNGNGIGGGGGGNNLGGLGGLL